jgi:hypothetical protein
MNEIQQYPLSDGDIRQLLGNDLPILTYPQLKQFRHIDQCFDKKGRCMILFLTNSATEGHWCCMIKKEKGIHFFDPYGDPPEEQKDGIPREKLERLDQNHPYLTRLLRKSELPVYYNTYQYQKDGGDVATCGRHCSVRLLYAPYSEDQYQSCIQKSGMTPDQFVIGVTFDRIGK